MNCSRHLLLFQSASSASTVVLQVGLLSIICLLSVSLMAQPYDEPDDGQPGDSMIQGYLREETEKIEADFLGALRSAADWNQARPRFVQEYYDIMSCSLGLGFLSSGQISGFGFRALASSLFHSK